MAVVPALIDDILAGKAVDLALRGVTGAWRAFPDEPDSLGRLLVLRHAVEPQERHAGLRARLRGGRGDALGRIDDP